MEALKKMRSPLQRLMVRKVAEIERIMEDDPTNRIEILALHLQLKRLGQKVEAVNARIENLRIKESEDQPKGDGVEDSEAEPEGEGVKDSEAEPKGDGVKDSEDEPKGDGVKDSEAKPKSDGVKDSETAIKGYELVNNSRAVAEGADQVKISDEAESIDDNEEGVVKVPALRKLVEKCRSRVNALKKQLDRLEKGKKKLQAEVEDLSMELESQRGKVMELEKNKSLLKQLRELEGELENERKQRANATAGRKKMEASHKEMEAQLEMANKIKEDALRQLKKLQSQASEAQRECEDLRLSRDEAQGQHKDVDKRIKSLESEVIALQEELSTAERARRSAEAEGDDLAEEANSKASRVTMLQDDKRRLETRIHQMEEEQAKAEGLAEKAHRAQSSVDLLTTEVAAERASCQKLENARSLLERQGKELRAKLQERETSQRARTKATIASLESKTCQLEEQLEAEGKERQALAKANRKLDKKVKEMSMQLEDEHRQSEHYKGKDHDANEVKNIDEVHCTDSKMEGKLDVEQGTDSKVGENIIDPKDWLNEENPPEVKGHYLPRRFLFRSESGATPIRPVFDDASSRRHSGLSLRRYLKKIPNLLKRISEIGIELRKNKYGVLADLRRYFRLMAIKSNDWDYLRFIWKKKMDN
ncbi:MYH11 [Cordylochernes scorpioides]|uniref:MYH11 n=1 Tax=Cordylochernes scorpioides TaxID=51811 RepID=A0ABY6L6V1_9ARAC|nr:MYH11 [Cordylochernes scorpioides]